MITCEYLQGTTCLQSTKMAETTANTTASACRACLAEPTRINFVTASLALNVIPMPRPKNKKYLIDLLKKHEPEGPGTELKKILSFIGVSTDKSCGCNEYLTKMNSWGVEGCTRHMTEIVHHLNTQEVSWIDMVKVALGGYLTTRSLVEESIKRSREIQA